MNRFDLIKREVCLSFGLPIADLVGPARPAHIAAPRQVAMYLARKRYGFSLCQCARMVGRKDHTTAQQAMRSTAQRMAKFPSFARQVEAIEERLG